MKKIHRLVLVVVWCACSDLLQHRCKHNLTRTSKCSIPFLYMHISLCERKLTFVDYAPNVACAEQRKATIRQAEKEIERAEDLVSQPVVRRLQLFVAS